MNKTVGNFIALLFGAIISFVLVEVILIFFNPFPARVRGNKIVLKSNYSKEVVIDPPIAGLDSSIRYSFNSLGFRGPELPSNDDTYKIITVGGSTTECSLLDDEKTWPYKLYEKLKKSKPNVWLNNAGMDGASTFGHLILLEDYLVDLKPDAIIFLIGVNDKGRANFDNEDGILIDRKESMWRKLLKKSEAITLISNIIDASKAKSVGLGHNLDTRYQEKNFYHLSPEEKEEITRIHKNYLPKYEDRVNEIISICKSNLINPVFVTQPLMYGDSSVTMVEIELYNNVTRNLALKSNSTLIDLAKELRNTEEFYYDRMHYTNRGAEEVANILYSQLNSLSMLDKKLPLN